MITLNKDIKFILDTLNIHGKGIIVGGYVRDSLLGLKPKDCDFATNLEYDKLINIFKNYSPKEIGKSFGILQITINGENYEIAKFRTDGHYSDSRKPDEVKFVNSFYEDAKRRDLTINAIGFDGKEIIDYFGGIEDLENKVIKFVGNPTERILEDNLRMMRAVRFSSTLNFSNLNTCIHAISKNSHLIKNVSYERIREELNKILLSTNPSNGIKLLESTGLLKYIIPELSDCFGYNQNNPHHEKDLAGHIMDVLDNIKPNIVARLSALFHDIEKPNCMTLDAQGISHYNSHAKESADMSEILMKRLKYDNETIKSVKAIIYDHMNKSENMSDKACKKFINRVGLDNLENSFELLYADRKSHKNSDIAHIDKLYSKCFKIINEKHPTTRFELSINGSDIIQLLNLKPSKKIGKILDKCIEYILEHPHKNTKEELVKFIKNTI